MDKIKGLVAAPFAPMDGEGCVQLSAIAGYYRMLVKNGIVGAFVNGSTGEGASLSFDEKVKICEQWTLAAKAQPAFRIINLVGGTSYVECQELARISERLGCHAIAILAPYYFRPAGVEQLVDYIALIASVVPKMQVYFYHIPVLAGSNFPMIELLKRVNGKIPNFVGIKYTHEDFHGLPLVSKLR
jgi:N-acetylneuraminate lyase